VLRSADERQAQHLRICRSAAKILVGGPANGARRALLVVAAPLGCCPATAAIPSGCRPSGPPELSSLVGYRGSKEDADVLGRQHILVEGELAAGDPQYAVDPTQHIASRADIEALLGFPPGCFDSITGWPCRVPDSTPQLASPRLKPIPAFVRAISRDACRANPLFPAPSLSCNACPGDRSAQLAEGDLWS
jgi:hypothetical protein